MNPIRETNRGSLTSVKIRLLFSREPDLRGLIEAWRRRFNLTTKPDYDVIVVGGGPAGATAARYLGERGVKTLLLDKSKFPRDKACGGGISARIMSRFPHLEEPLQGIPLHWVHQVYLESPGGLSLRQVSDIPLYLMIRRYEFDNLLFQLAKEKVEAAEEILITEIAIAEDKVTVHAKGGKAFTSQILIGADGANSIVARQTRLRSESDRKEFAIDMMEETPYETLDFEDRDTMYVYYGIQGHYGYGYIFPKVDHINLGVGYKLDYYLSTFKNRHYENYLNFLGKMTEADLVKGRSNSDNFMAFPIPVRGPLAKTYSNRVLLAGDAGGFVNAFTAEGIYFGMVSAEYAAKAACAALEIQDFSEASLQNYEKSWKAEIGVDLSKSVRIQDYLLANPSRIDRVVKGARRDKKLAELLTKYATGTIGYKDFKRAVMIKVLPQYVWYKFKKVLGLYNG